MREPLLCSQPIWRPRHRPLRRVACAVARPAAWPPPARDVAAAGAGPGSVAARAKKWSAARAAQRTGASSRCGAQYGEFALRPARALSLASRLRWLRKSFLSVRFSCFSSKRPNSAAMTDVGAARVRREAFALASRQTIQKKFGGCERRGLRPKERVLRMQNLMFFSHTTQTQTQTLRSPQLPRWQGDASPDGVRWWGPATQL